MIICGVDQSLSCTGLARIESIEDYSPMQLGRIPVKVKSPITLEARHQRLERIEDEFVQWTAGSDLIVFEALGFGAKGRSLTDLAGLQWILMHRAWEEGIPYTTVTPTQRGLYATGHGKPPKQDVLDAVNGEMFGGLNAADDNEADAAVLAAMGARWYGYPMDTTPITHWPSLHLINWPIDR